MPPSPEDRIDREQSPLEQANDALTASQSDLNDMLYSLARRLTPVLRNHYDSEMKSKASAEETTAATRVAVPVSPLNAKFIEARDRTDYGRSIVQFLLKNLEV